MKSSQSSYRPKPTSESHSDIQSFPIKSNLITASIGKRFSAQFIDELIAAFFGYSAMLVLMKLLTDESSIPMVTMIIIIIGYTLFADGMFSGQSIGKKVMKLFVVRVGTNAPCTYGLSIVRNITYLIGIFDLVTIFGAQKRRVGDYLAGTKVLMEM